jgi:hypothetical protein
MSNTQILTILGIWVVILITWLRHRLGEPSATTLRWLAIITGGVLGFIWYLCSNVEWLRWILQIAGVQPVSEHWFILILKGFIAGFGSTYAYATLRRIFKGE